MSETTAQVREVRRSGPVDGGSQRIWRSAARWETGLVAVLIGVIIFGTHESSTFLNTTTLFYMGINVGFIAIMALPVTLVVMTGEIDLSVASMLGLSGATVGYLWHHGWAIWPAFAVALLVGALGGALNGFLVAKVGLPSIAVTIGTLTLFRGLAEILLGSQTVPGLGDRPLPTSLTKVGVLPLPHTHISYSMGIFVVLAVIFAVVLHATPLGRSMIAIGLQPEAAVFSGISVNAIKFGLFVLSGVMSAFAGILLTLQNASVSYSAGTGLELNVIAIVLFGGVSIFGGRGTILGVVLAAAIVGSLQMALTQMQIQPEVQNIITGILLLISVVVPGGGDAIRRVRDRFAQSRATA